MSIETMIKTKPIGPTRAFVNEERANEIENYARKTDKKTNVGFDRIRQMMRESRS